jgi:hypothetical protein
MTKTLRSLNEALDYFGGMLEANPQRDMHAAENAVLDGRRREWPCIGLIHPDRPDDRFVPAGELELPKVEMPDGEQAGLARQIIGKLGALKMLNPISCSLGLGCGTATFVTAFGIPPNPEANNSPAFDRKLDDVLAEAPPDVETAGVMPEMRRRIELIRACTPDWLKIELPDCQGLYNIAHAIIGEEALTAPYTEPEKFHELMRRVTDYWIAAVRLLRGWIGPRRQTPWNRIQRVCECSVNLVSPRMYEEHLLPYDLRVAQAFGPLDVHTCSGQHVFDVTLKNLPGVVATEAGYGDGLSAGYTAISHAIEAIGSRPIVLRIGQMLPQGQEFEFICRDLDLYERTPRLLFHYTGMYWLKKDRPAIRDLHKRLDEYWAHKYA